jgi:hypothetical protein
LLKSERFDFDKFSIHFSDNKSFCYLHAVNNHNEDMIEFHFNGLLAEVTLSRVKKPPWESEFEHPLHLKQLL